MTLVTKTSLVSPPHVVQIDPYGTNPLAEDYRQVNADTYALSTKAAGPPPKMFAGGTADLPAFTASGVDPQLLARLPYTARHAVAANPDVAAVHGIFEEHADNPDLNFPHAGLQAAVGRVRDWASGRLDTTPTGATK